MLLSQSKKRVSQESKTFGRLWEMQIKAVLWDHLSLLITESITKTTKSVKDVREKEPSVTAYRKVSLRCHYGSQWGASSNPTETHTKDSKSTYHRDFCTSMIIAVLLTITKIGTAPTHCQHICQHKLTVVHMHSGILFYFYCLKETIDEVKIFAGKWMEIEITLSKIIQTQKD